MSANISQLVGNWTGTYESAVIGKSKVNLSFFQLDSETLRATVRGAKAKTALAAGSDTVAGVFITETGAIGTIELTITDGNFVGTAHQTTPGCQTTYQMKGKLTGNAMAWTFSGHDCLGDESGQGIATLFGFTA